MSWENPLSPGPRRPPALRPTDRSGSLPRATLVLSRRRHRSTDSQGSDSVEVRTPGPPPSRSHVAKFSAETGWLGDFANSGKHLLAEPINPAQARMKPQEHSRDHISVTVARMSQRVRAKRGPMTDSAICGIP